MSASHSKSEFLYAQVRQALQAGRYPPGQRIDPGTLALEFHTSPTPVRFALYRLVGEGLIEDHARSGLHVPLPTEVGLRQQYDWMQHLLQMACEFGFAPFEVAYAAAGAGDAQDGSQDSADRTWQLFEAMGRAVAHAPCQRAVRQINDQLAPIRPTEQPLLDHPAEELDRLKRLWAERDIDALRHALRDYHEHRKQLAPCIVAILNTKASRFH